MKNKEEIITMWAKGHYALGWRGWLAMKLLEPALNRAFYDINHQALSNK